MHAWQLLRMTRRCAAAAPHATCSGGPVRKGWRACAGVPLSARCKSGSATTTHRHHRSISFAATPGMAPATQATQAVSSDVTDAAPQDEQHRRHSQHATQVLHVDAAALPAAAAPPAAQAQAYLSATHPVDLGRASCPHLYYTKQQQQQPHDSTPATMTALQHAAQLLASGEPVAIPTETVYGLAANALSARAVAAVFAAKGRPADNPLIVHVSDLDMLARLYPSTLASAAGGDASGQRQHVGGSSGAADSSSSSSSGAAQLAFIPPQYRALIAAFWPGPLTLLLPASPLVPAGVTAGLPTMAVRMPAHPVARALIAAAGVPLAAPSANTSGRPSPTSAQHVLQDLDGAIAAVVDGGACACGVESTVLDGLRRPPAVLRPGGITAEQLRGCAGMAGLQVYQRDFCDAQLEAQPTTPGMKYRHYSPSAHLVLLDPTPAWQQQQQQQGSQCSRSSLEELVAAQTDTLLQQLLLRHQHGAAGGPRQHIVLLSTCHPAGPGQDQQQQCPGWTVSSLHALQSASQQQLQQQQQEELATPRVLQYVLGSWQQPEVIAQHVFAALRAADATQPAAIVVQGLPPHGAGLAVMNRLLKAASQRVDVDAGVLGSCRR